MTWANGFSGSVNIQVTANGCNGPSSQVIRTVTITPTVGTPTAITVSAGTQPTCQLTNGTTTTTYATTATNSTGFNWSLSNGAAGSIGATTGVMTWANGFSGSVNIQVTANGCNGPSSQVIRTVTVTPNAFVGSITGTSPICIGATTTFTANSVVLGGGTATWSSSNTGVATIDPITGLATGVSASPPTTTITYTIAGGCGGASATKTLAVFPNASVASVTGTSPLCVGSTPVIYHANTVVLSGGTGAWSTSDPGVATVSSTGTVTPVGAGTATITFTITGGCNGTQSAFQSVTIYSAAAIGTPPSNATVTYGNPASFSVLATGTPAPTYQWQVNTGSGFNNISGETSSTLTIANPTVAMTGYLYHVIVTNSCATVTSSDVSLTVNPLARNGNS